MARGVVTAAEVEVLGAGGGALTEHERNQLEAHEQTIEGGLKSFFEVGQALTAIRDNKLYRATHRTFAAYCADRWGMARSTAYQTIDAAEAAANLSAMADISPTSERQIRPLAGLDRDQMVAAWQLAVDRAEGAPTGRQVQAAVDEVLGRTADAAIEEVVAEDEGEGGDDPPRPPSLAAAAGKALGLSADQVRDAVRKAEQLTHADLAARRDILADKGHDRAEAEAIIARIVGVQDLDKRRELGALVAAGYDFEATWAEVIEGKEPDFEEEVFGNEGDDFDPAPAAVPIRGGASAGGPVPEERMDDEQWLRQATVRERLANARLFDQEALRWRRLRRARQGFLDALRAQGLGARRGETQGPLTSLWLRAARAPHPWSWMLCGTCMGRGAVADRGTCPHCRGGGFQLG